MIAFLKDKIIVLFWLKKERVLGTLSYLFLKKVIFDKYFFSFLVIYKLIRFC